MKRFILIKLVNINLGIEPKINIFLFIKYMFLLLRMANILNAFLIKRFGERSLSSDNIITWKANCERQIHLPRPGGRKPAALKYLTKICCSNSVFEKSKKLWMKMNFYPN